jgi:hypothetical protein
VISAGGEVEKALSRSSRVTSTSDSTSRSRRCPGDGRPWVALQSSAASTQRTGENVRRTGEPPKLRKLRDTGFGASALALGACCRSNRTTSFGFWTKASEVELGPA